VSIEIRAIQDDDVAAVVRLSDQLGYPTTESAIRSRISVISASASDAVWVAVGRERGVEGWIHVAHRILLESEPFAEILGLVVDERSRGNGVGAALVHRAEAWARDLAVFRMRVRSNIVRERARGFYEGLGYEVFKQQAVFDRRLES
jgi:GNAT superfamily N-acetyltransferase